MSTKTAQVYPPAVSTQAVNSARRASNLALAWMRAVASKAGPVEPTSRHVLLTLATHMDKHGRAYPSHKLLAEETGLTERSVGQHLRLAESAGWIRVYEKHRPGKAWRWHEYEAVISNGSSDSNNIVPELASGPRIESNGIRPEPASGPSASAETDDGPEGSSSPTSRRGVGEDSPNALRNASALLASRPAIDGTRSGTSFHEVRNHVPTNSPKPNSTKITLHQDQERAREIAESLRPAPKPETNSAETRIAKLRTVITGMPDASDETIRRCVSDASLEEVRQARSPTP
jgi:hypothetical protein